MKTLWKRQMRLWHGMVLVVTIFGYCELRLFQNIEQNHKLLVVEKQRESLRRPVVGHTQLKSQQSAAASPKNNNENESKSINGNKEHWRKWAGNKIYRQIQARASLQTPLPIIVVGLPKAGTSSLFHFFHCNSLSSQHFYCCTKQNSTLYQVGSSYISTCMLKNLQEPGRLILQDCGDAFYQAFTELNGPRSSSRQESTGDARHPTTSLGPRIFLPQHFELKQLYRQFPKATWILNQRNVASWVDSVLNWEEEEPGAGSLKTQLINEYHMQYGTELQPVDERQFLEWLYYNHTNTVKEFHKSHATISLIEMDIEDPGAGRKLGATTGLDPFCWNQQNKNDGWNQNHDAKK